MHLSRFLGELLWKYRKDTAVSGMNWYIQSFFHFIVLICLNLKRSWGFTLIRGRCFYWNFRYLSSSTFCSCVNISCCIVARMVKNLSRLPMNQFRKMYKALSFGLDLNMFDINKMYIKLKFSLNCISIFWDKTPHLKIASCIEAKNNEVVEIFL